MRPKDIWIKGEGIVRRTLYNGVEIGYIDKGTVKGRIKEATEISSMQSNIRRIKRGFIKKDS